MAKNHREDLVLVLTLRRDLNALSSIFDYDKALNWMVSGFRWLRDWLLAKAKLVSDGAISHARVQWGVEVFRALLAKLVVSFKPLPADFHGRTSVVFDGSTGTMPDTEPNQAAFGKPKARKDEAAFPQVRLMALLAVAHRRLLEVAFAPYTGKGTGERAWVRGIVEGLICQGLLFLLVEDARQSDDVDAPATPTGRKRWKTVTLTVRVIRIEIPGFRPFWLMTNLLDPAITAREIASHYHRRWDMEIAYDEIKTHQCATLRGQSPTTFRSKPCAWPQDRRPELVKQEIYALAIMYNLVRTLISQTASEHGQDPQAISFLDALQQIIDAVPLMTADTAEHREKKRPYLLAVIADCLIDRPRRPRLNPRVVKVKMSKFACKRPIHKSETRDLAKELKIVDVELVGVPAG
jgi:hypothetical protein